MIEYNTTRKNGTGPQLDCWDVALLDRAEVVDASNKRAEITPIPSIWNLVTDRDMRVL